VGAYSINIVGLKDTEHLFQYEFGGEFFQVYGSDLVSEGKFQVDVMMDKREILLDVDFKIRGVAKLTCDRSLETFDYPIQSTRKIVFKYGDADEEITDEIIIIHRDTATLALGQYIYEFIALAIPIKKLHPRFDDEVDEDGSEGKIVYSSGESSQSDSNTDDEIDPRWNILKKLK
jgi:uncharacterized metal-binding protein YceD (DUF177 family)